MNFDKEAIQKLMNLSGEARGMHFKNDSQYILAKWGDEGLKKVEDKTREWGYPIDYAKINQLDFYPVGLRAVSLLAIKETLELKDKDIRELCGFAVAASLIVKLYLKFFYSIPKTIEKASHIWQEYFTIGELEVKEYKEHEKYFILDVKNADIHSVFCGPCMEGYLRSLIKMVIKSNVECQEIKCSFKGDNIHRYLVKWK